VRIGRHDHDEHEQLVGYEHLAEPVPPEGAQHARRELSIVAIVLYLNRITRQQYVGRILERIADETLGLVRELPYGSRVGQRVGGRVPSRTSPPGSPPAWGRR
jgi:hypothetical protein